MNQENQELDIYCNMIPSKLNPERYLCQDCGQSISKEDFDNNALPMCYNKLEMAALREDIPQVRLKSIKFLDKNDNEIQTVETPQPMGLAIDWWNYNPNSSIKTQQEIAELPQHSHNDTKITMQNSTIKTEATEEEVNRRMDICQGCEFFKNNMCLKCGCALSREQNYHNKLYNANAKCPVGKW